MNKIVNSLGALSLVATMATADMGFYAGGGLAYESVPDWNGASSGVGIVLRGGMNLDMVLEGFGAEVELTKSVIDPEYGTDDQNIVTLAGYAVYSINITKDWYVKPRFGIILPNLGDDESVNSRDIGFTSGIGGGYRIMDNLSLYIDYTILGEYVTNWGTGVEYHF